MIDDCRLWAARKIASHLSVAAATATIRALSEDGHVRISVRDCGPGIPPNELPRIFERYYRAADNRDRVPGTGIGLAVARDIVKAHGGEIWAESKPGQARNSFSRCPLARKRYERWQNFNRR